MHLPPGDCSLKPKQRCEAFRWSRQGFDRPARRAAEGWFQILLVDRTEKFPAAL